MKTKTRNLLLAGGAVALLGGGAWWWKSASSSTPAPEKTSSIATAEKKNLEIRAEAAGVVEPIRVVEVKSKASGEVLKVLVETGDHVEQGALLAEIDPRDVQNALEQAQADLESATVKLETTAAQHKRMEALRGSGVVTQQEYEAAIDAAASARATSVRARTNLQLARERRQDVTIRAPIAGTVIARSVEPGQIIASATSNVSGGTALFAMADLSSIQVRAKLDETDVGQVKSGQPVRVTVEAFPGRQFQGSVLKIEPQAVVEQNVTMFPVLVRLENKEGLLKPGMNAEVTIEVATKRDAVVVPNAAVVSLREARAAAEVLGIDSDALRTAIQRNAGADPEAGSESAVTGTSGAIQQIAGTEPSPECAALLERARGGGGWQSLSEEDREKMRACRGEAGGGMRRGGGNDAPQGEQRPGVLFVRTASGSEPRRVTLGLSDWENTEVVRGLEPGEQVILISVARLQKQQQDRLDRIRRGAGNPMTGGGGAGGGPRR